MKKIILFACISCVYLVSLQGQTTAICGNHSFEGNIGIGIPINALYRLNVKGLAKMDSIQTKNISFYPETFQYDGQSLGRYALTWTEDSWHPASPSLWLTANAGIKLFTGEATPRVSIRNNGNVGIGTDDPASKLHINGDLTVNENLYVPSNKKIVVGNPADRNRRLVFNFISGATSEDSYIDYGGDLFFRHSASNYPAIGFMRDGSVVVGMVGSPHPRPKTKMIVDGTIFTNKIEVKTNVWADHVFSDDYELISLTEVKNHIEKNKHLPGIPKKTEVLENGVDLGEMQVKLLQKIEELTLYAIQQQQLIDTLFETIDELKNK